MAKAIGYLGTCTAAIIVVGYMISFPVFYGLFAFSDYENWDCYALQDHSVTTPWMGDPNDVPGDYHNVSANFYMVNLWGFINFVAPLGIGCFYLCCMLVDRSFRL